MADLNQIINTDDVNKQVNILTYCMKIAINECAPLINTRVKRKPNKWIMTPSKGKSKNEKLTKLLG